MRNQVLLVDKVRQRRRVMVQALAAKGHGVLEMDDCFTAMSAVGRADFSGVVLFEEKRHLTMRGLCLLARKRHPGIALVVLCNAETVPSQLAAALEVRAVLLPADASVEQVLDALQTEMRTNAMEAVPNTGVVNLAVAMAEAEVAGKDPARGAVPEPVFPPQPVAPPAEKAPLVLEGDLEDSSGAGVVMALFAQELTGRLNIRGNASVEGAYFFLRGEPVGCDFEGGDKGLWAGLVADGLVQAGPAPAVPEGQLLSVVAGQVPGDALHGFLRKSVRDRLLFLLASKQGTFRFEEDRTFLDVTPLLKFNPLGLVVEAARKEMSPDAVMAESVRVEGMYLHPLPGLASASKKMEPFLRGASAVAIINGQATVGQFWTDSKLGPLMGTVMAFCLERMGLVTMEDAPFVAGRSSVQLTHRVARQAPEPEDVHAPDADAEANEDKDVRNRVFALYARIKPLTQPRQVLGVPPHAGMAEIKAAYDALMAQLTASLPEGSAKGMLSARMEEVQRKVTAAYQALALTEDAPDNSNNPF